MTEDNLGQEFCTLEVETDRSLNCFLLAGQGWQHSKPQGSYHLCLPKYLPTWPAFVCVFWNGTHVLKFMGKHFAK